MSGGNDRSIQIAMGRRSPPPNRPAIKPPLPPPPPRPDGRHSAIGNKVPDLKAYKRWAEAVRDSWKEEKG